MSMRVLLKKKTTKQNQDHDINFLYCKSEIETLTGQSKEKKLASSETSQPTRDERKISEKTAAIFRT